MAVGFERALPPAPPGAIETVEARLEITLPDDYKEFLRRHNGGYVESNFFPAGGGCGHVRYLYSAGPNDDEYVDDLEGAARRYWPPSRPGDPIDPSFLPIGEEDLGNVICLKVGGEDYGAVYFWDHELAVSVGPYTHLADSFSEYFEGLRPIEELEA